MNIKVEIKRVYGNDTIYPACDLSIKFAKLLGTKTLTSSAIKGIKELGYSVEVVQKVVSL